MRPAVLVEAMPLSPSVRRLVFRCGGGEPLAFVPGQWVNLQVPVNAQPQTRAYSLAAAPDVRAPERFEIAVTRVDGGPVSEALHALPVGASVAFDGPHGFFTREAERDEHALLVGTGTGVCPLRAMLQAELARPHGPPIGLLFGCRTRADVLYADELQALARTRPRFSLHVTLSQPDERWRGLSGHVQAHLHALVDPLRPPHVYVCGLVRMVREVRRVLKDELAIDRRRIHSERYD